MKKSLFRKMLELMEKENLKEKVVSDADEYRKYKDLEDSDFDEPSKTKNVESQYKKLMNLLNGEM